MSHPAPISTTINATCSARISRPRNRRLENMACGCDYPFRLSFQLANKGDQGVDFVFLQFLPEGRHVAAYVAAVRDRVEDAFVADVGLPVRVCKIARVAIPAFRSFGLAIGAVTRDAIAPV